MGIPSGYTSAQVVQAVPSGIVGGGDAVSFTPTFTNLTVGNGTVTAAYCEINDVVFVTGQVTFGSTTSISGAVVVNHPVGTLPSAGVYQIGARFFDVGTANIAGIIQINTTNASLFSTFISSNRVVAQSLSATSPFTWTTSDVIYWNYHYRKA